MAAVVAVAVMMMLTLFYDDDDDDNDDFLNKRYLYHFILQPMPHVHARCRREVDAAPYTCMHTCMHAYTYTNIHDACMHACIRVGELQMKDVAMKH